LWNESFFSAPQLKRIPLGLTELSFHVKAAIEEKLGVLVDLPLWAVGRAGTVSWFQFGAHHAVPARKIEIKDVGDYALHTECEWTLASSTYGDVIATSESSRDELASLGSLGLVCQEVTADDRGGFVLQFASGHCLKVEPEDEEAEEFWRLLEPHRKTPHFVVGAGGHRTA